LKPRPQHGTPEASDREETLKKAEKFLRQGRLDQAIAEYERVVEDQPRDWTTANALGDLYVRGNKTDRAVALYQKVADHLFGEGFYPKAAALYRKILKLAPGDEKVLLNLAEISTKQGLLADAKAHLTTIGARRRDRGDTAGADDIVIRLGSLDPADVDARLAAARIVETRGDTAGAAARYRELYEYLVEKGRDADALPVLRDAVRCDPSDAAARATLARAAVKAGAFDEAQQYLDRETAGEDPDLLFALITMEMQAGRIESAQELLRQLFALEPDRRYAVVELAWSMLDSNIFAASACVDAAANALSVAGEYAEAASILQEFAARVPGQVNALLKLVEVCVDGGLEQTMYEAQAQLADAYLAIGLAAEARVIAEDLLSREPWEPAHVDRLRRSLVMLKVPNVEAVIAQRLSAPPDEHISPVVRDDVDEPPVPHRRLLSERPLPPIPDQPRPPQPEPPRTASSDPALAPEPVASAQPARPRGPTEVDLTTELGTLHGESGPGSPEPERPTPALGHVFAGIRAQSDAEEGEAGEHLALAKTYLEMGMASEATGPLEVAAKSPRHRFEAATLLARLFKDQQDLARAIEWFERAAQAPASSLEAGRQLLYDLGAALQQTGEKERALAVFLELDADAPGYRDVATRIADLSRNAGG
jgi:tetratricopeptide (TPR) repeat protein